MYFLVLFCAPTICTTQRRVIEPARAILFSRNCETIAISYHTVDISFAFCVRLYVPIRSRDRVYVEIKRTVTATSSRDTCTYILILYTQRKNERTLL